MAPFAQPAFLALWAATVASNIGTWMQDVGAGWLMTELSPSPLVVAMVQAATTLPVFLFALLAGAVADIVDRRLMLLVLNIYLGLVSAAMAALVYFQLMTPALLVGFTFLMGTGAAFLAPAWQAIVPKLVPRSELAAAITLNSMGINISRAVGPAIAGILIVSLGLTAPFAINALSVLGIIAALLWWKPALSPATTLPREHVLPAIRAGVLYALNSVPLRSTLIRAVGFFLFASAYWAMLPLIARTQLDGGVTLYGILLASIGAGAVVGAFLLPGLQRRMGPGLTVMSGAIGTALVLLVFTASPSPMIAISASLLAGLCWIGVLSTLNVSAQTSLPDWVRARGLSVYLTVFFGSMSLGSLGWGQVANVSNIDTALVLAAGGMVLFSVLTMRARLNLGEAINTAPSMHWPAPVLTGESPPERAPVSMEVTYLVDAGQQHEFRLLMKSLKAARQRSGGYRWTLSQDQHDAHRFIERWHEMSWTDHLRHHERVSHADRELQARISAILRPGTQPQVLHTVPSSRKPGHE